MCVGGQVLTDNAATIAGEGLINAAVVQSLA
jgi:hypothetical protein